MLEEVNGYQRAIQYQQLEKPQFGAAQPPGFYFQVWLHTAHGLLPILSHRLYGTTNSSQDALTIQETSMHDKSRILHDWRLQAQLGCTDFVVCNLMDTSAGLQWLHKHSNGLAELYSSMSWIMNGLNDGMGYFPAVCGGPPGQKGHQADEGNCC